MALNKLTADALVDGTLDADAIGPASITTAKLHSNIISGQTAIGSVDVSNDLLLIYDNDATSLKKVPVSSVGATNTDGLTEGSSNLYFTNTRADARITNAIKDEDNMASNSATHIPSQQSVKAYVDTEVAGLVSSAPGTLDTLNELAAALGDDANFSTTVTNSIATKLPLAGGTLTGDLTIPNKLIHAGDTNTYLQFIDDNINLVAGGYQFLNGTSTSVTLLKDIIGYGKITTDGIGQFNDYIDLNTVGNRGKIGYDSNNVYIGSTASAGQIIFKNGITSTDAPQTSGTELVRINSAGLDVTGTVTSDGLTVDGEVSIAPASGTAKVRLTSQGSGSEVFTVNGQIPGVANGGFAIRNETDSRNDFTIDAVGAATFGGTVASGELLSTVGLKVAGHPVVGYASFDSGYATRLGSTGTSTLNATQIFAGGAVQATFKGGNVGIGTVTTAAKLHVEDGDIIVGNWGTYPGSGGNSDNASTASNKLKFALTYNSSAYDPAIELFRRNNWSATLGIMPNQFTLVSGHSFDFRTGGTHADPYGTRVVNIDDNGNLLMESGQVKLATLSSNPSSPLTGGMYFNNTTNSVKVYNGSGWENLKTSFIGSGGTEYNFTDSNGVTYKVHAFLGSGTFTATGSGSIDVMIVAGGGGGGGSTAGGGGAGGLVYTTSTAINSGSHSIIVGGGGAGSQKANDGSPNNTNGANSSAFGTTALGGGYGYSGRSVASRRANSGGSGGGGGYYSGNDILDTAHSGSGTSGQGNRGGYGNDTGTWGGAGGGGAGGVGIDMNSTRAGGAGSNMSSYFGTNYGVSGLFAGGGGGGAYNTAGNTPGGSGGGGQGGTGSSSIPTAGTANTGGGGGGGGFYQSGPGGGAGGSGIVLIRYEV